MCLSWTGPLAPGFIYFFILFEEDSRNPGRRPPCAKWTSGKFIDQNQTINDYWSVCSLHPSLLLHFVFLICLLVCSPFLYLVSFLLLLSPLISPFSFSLLLFPFLYLSCLLSFSSFQPFVSFPFLFLTVLYSYLVSSFVLSSTSLPFCLLLSSPLLTFLFFPLLLPCLLTAFVPSSFVLSSYFWPSSLLSSPFHFFTLLLFCLLSSFVLLSPFLFLSVPFVLSCLLSSLVLSYPFFLFHHLLRSFPSFSFPPCLFIPCSSCFLFILTLVCVTFYSPPRYNYQFIVFLLFFFRSQNHESTEIINRLSIGQLERCPIDYLFC